MTREEQILEYANSFKGKGMESEELKEIIRLAIIDGAKWADNHPMKHSLPSDLDEAAEKIAWDIAPMYPDISWDNCFEKIKEGIKAGAEWMAGQGVTLDSLIWRDEDDKLFIEAFVDENKFKMAENVTIQVRKKQ